MISIEGASLLAQVIPVLALIIAVERRPLGPAPLPKSRLGRVWYVSRAWALSLSIAFAAGAEATCITAVSRSRPVDGLYVVLVIVGTFAVGAGAAISAIYLALNDFVGPDPSEKDRPDE